MDHLNMNTMNISNLNIFEKVNLDDIAKKLRWDNEKLRNVFFQIPHHLNECYNTGKKLSHDPVTQIGSCLVNSDGAQVASGYNGFITPPDGLDISQVRLHPNAQKPAKYNWFEHAERRVIYDFVKYGSSYDDFSKLIMFCPYFSCTDCSRAICLSGIKLVIGHKTPISKCPDRWRESIEIGRKMFDEYGVMYYEWEGIVGNTMMMDNVLINV